MTTTANSSSGSSTVFMELNMDTATVQCINVNTNKREMKRHATTAKNDNVTQDTKKRSKTLMNRDVHRHPTNPLFLFLMVHFKVLRALYDKQTKKGRRSNDDVHLDDDRNYNSTEAADNNTRMDIESDMDDDSWEQIQCFLDQRLSLLQTQQRMVQLRKIHTESIRYGGGCSNGTTDDDDDNWNKSTRNINAKLPAVSVQSEKSRNSHPMHQYNVTHPKSTQNASSVSSFRMISNIIGQHRYKSISVAPTGINVNNDSKKITMTAMQQLRHTVQTRIQSLQSIQEQTQQSMYERTIQSLLNMTTPIKLQRYSAAAVVPTTKQSLSMQQQHPHILYSDRSYQIELQYKIQLWSLLSHDLNEVLKLNHEATMSDNIVM
jgi:hypothetical protein